MVDRIKGGEESDREGDVHEWPGNGNEEPVPAGMRHELTRVACGLVHGVFTAHFHVAAERDGANPIVSISPAETQKTWSEAHRKNFHADAQELGCGVVAPFVDHDHDAQ